MRHLVQWLPYLLHPSTPDDGRPEPELLEVRLPTGASDWGTAIEAGTIEVEQRWPLTIVFNILADRAASWHVQGKQWAAARRKPTTVKEARQWIDATRSLAARLPLIGQTTDRMLAAAAGVERTLESPRRFFLKHPTTISTKADGNWRASLHVWALDRLLRAVNESELVHASLYGGKYVDLKPTELWPALFTPPEDQPDPMTLLPFADYIEARKRVMTLERKIKPGERDALMIHVLKGALDTGHLKPDGTLRTPDRSYPATSAK